MAINGFQEAIYEFLRDLHRGEKEAIHSCELEKVFGTTGPQIRVAINRLRTNGYPSFHSSRPSRKGDDCNVQRCVKSDPAQG